MPVSGWSAEDAGDQQGKVVVLTGANSGVGLEAARVLAVHGARVVLACRDPHRAEAARADIERTIGSDGTAGSVTTVILDLADLDSVARCAEALAAEHQRIDVLVNNAGVMGGLRGFTAQGFERQMGTNHLGHFALTARLWPLLAAPPAGRVVVLSSLAARTGRLKPSLTRDDLVAPRSYAPIQVYGNTKQANLLFAQELQRRLAAAGSPVRAIAVHPGVSSTNLFHRQLTDTGLGWLAPVARSLTLMLLQAPSAGALPTLRAACDPDVPGGAFLGPRGLGQLRGRPELIDVYKSATNPVTASRLWELSEEIVELTFDVGERAPR
jgi:NAD(P)-dependent dehydrogenase (short-subunit alcohol dehydrogenase family)